MFPCRFLRAGTLPAQCAWGYIPALMLFVGCADSSKIRPTVITYPDGTLEAKGLEVNFRGRTTRHGQWTEWYPNGNPKSLGWWKNSSFYMNNPGMFSEKDGMWLTWHPNGIRAMVCWYQEGVSPDGGDPAPLVVGPLGAWTTAGDFDEQVSGYYLAGSKVRDLTPAELKWVRTRHPLRVEP